MNRHRPDNGEKDKRDIKPFSGPPSLVSAIEQIPADMHIQEQISVQDNHVPTQHRPGEVKLSNTRDEVPKPVRSAKVNCDEGQAHDDRGDGEQFAEDDKIV